MCSLKERLHLCYSKTNLKRNGKFKHLCLSLHAILSPTAGPCARHFQTHLGTASKRTRLCQNRIESGSAARARDRREERQRRNTAGALERGKVKVKTSQIYIQTQQFGTER